MTMALEFGDLPSTVLGGSFAAVRFLDRDGNPNLIIERDKGADITIRWTVTGDALPVARRRVPRPHLRRVQGRRTRSADRQARQNRVGR